MLFYFSFFLHIFLDCSRRIVFIIMKSQLVVLASELLLHLLSPHTVTFGSCPCFSEIYSCNFSYSSIYNVFRRNIHEVNKYYLISIYIYRESN